MILASPTRATITNIYKDKEIKFINKNKGILEKLNKDYTNEENDKLKKDKTNEETSKDN